MLKQISEERMTKQIHCHECNFQYIYGTHLLATFINPTDHVSMTKCKANIFLKGKSKQLNKQTAMLQNGVFLFCASVTRTIEFGSFAAFAF